jgi:CHAD domain-containing protein
MIDPAPLLTHPAPDAARALALSFVARLADARNQLRENPGSESALHDARVAITRLRGTLRAYHEVLGAGISKRGRRALRKINRALGHVRDLDVQRDWLSRHVDAMPALATAAARTFLEQLAHKRDERAPRIDAVFTRYFDASVETWQHQLRHYDERRVVGEPLQHEPLAAVVVQQMHHALNQFEHAVQAAGAEPSADRLHAARIAIKRLRALLVPWLDVAPAVRSLYDTLSAAQDSLGNQRDVHLLAQRVRRAAQRQTSEVDAFEALAGYCNAEHARLAAAVESSCPGHCKKRISEFKNSRIQVQKRQLIITKLVVHIEKFQLIVVGIIKQEGLGN